MRTEIGKCIPQRGSENGTGKGTCHLLVMKLALTENCHFLKIGVRLSPRYGRFSTVYTHYIQACFLVAGSDVSTENTQKGPGCFLTRALSQSFTDTKLFISLTRYEGKGPSHNLRAFQRTKFAASKIQIVSSMQSSTLEGNATHTTDWNGTPLQAGRLQVRRHSDCNSRTCCYRSLFIRYRTGTGGQKCRIPF